LQQRTIEERNGAAQPYLQQGQEAPCVAIPCGNTQWSGLGIVHVIRNVRVHVRELGGLQQHDDTRLLPGRHSSL
jgi:hypothetical protein